MLSYNPGKWDFPGGAMHFGETLQVFREGLG